MENEVATLKNTIRLDTEVKYQGIQMEGQVPKIGEELGKAMEVDEEEELESGKEIEVRTSKNLLIHKINTLKLVS